MKKKSQQFLPLNKVIARRKVLKLLGLGTSSLVFPSLSGLFSSPAMAQSKSAEMVFSQSTWDNKQLQQIVSSMTLASLANIGIPETQVAIAYPLSNMPNPTNQFRVSFEEIGIGSDFFEGSIQRGIDPKAMSEFIAGITQPDEMEVLKGLFANAMQLQGSLESMATTNMAQAAAPAAGFLPFVPVAIAIIGGISLLITIYDHMDSDGDGVRNGIDKFPNDPNKHVMLPDLNGDGIPDDIPGGPVVYLRDNLNTLGIGPSLTEGLTAQVSFTPTESALVIDCAVQGSNGATATQIVIVG